MQPFACLEGAKLKIRGRLSGSETLAVRLEVDNSNPDRLIVQSPVSDFTTPGNPLTIIGLIDIGSISVYAYGRFSGSGII